MMRRSLAILILLALLMGLAACSAAVPGATEQTGGEQTTASGGEQPPAPEDLPFQVSVYSLGNWFTGQNVIYFGSNGERVTTPARAIRDVFTDEVRYYTVSHTTGPASTLMVAASSYQTLYDLSGQVLKDQLYGSIDGAVGDLLIRRFDEGNNGLWDPARDKYVVKDIGGLCPLNEDRALALDQNNCLWGILDRKNLEVTEVDLGEPLSYQGMKCGLILTMAVPEEGDTTMVILDSDLKELYRSGPEGYCYEGQIFDLGEAGILICINDQEGGSILRLKDGEIRTLREMKAKYSYGLNLLDCSSSCMIVQEQGNTFLCDLEGKRLSESYELMGRVRAGVGQEERYGARRDRTIYILNAQGHVLDQREFPGLSEVYFEGGAICYTRPPSGDGTTSYDDYVTGLMDAGFHDMISPVAGSYINTLRIEEGTDFIWAVFRYVRGGVHYDLYTSDLRPIITDLTIYGTVTEQGIAVQKGFSQGIIDFEGNWIARYSIYEDTWRD